ncbi:DUF2927 domain-containing protein [Vibrio sp. JPW-9-11-11]|uniref:DUF2927 domain-containing protein n=1 Tax=Vibrio sp. JPW-9-11-11 TaxID=1416532 RepID=UPI00159448CC|nr:DUF2927 domain-containing protein [Vibrio sp. JPW-9-11-11]NVD06398.1 DUF2927 domain-containing protein [Vibrio sp. JPW-9-11-11]
MLRTATLILVSLLASSQLFASQIPQTWHDPKFVETAFINVALRNEYSAGSKPLVKWQEPVKIWVEHKVGDRDLHDELTNAHIRHLEHVTGHLIRRVNSADQANVTWIYTRESKWREDIETHFGVEALKHVYGAICKAGYQVASDGAISRAAVIIPVDQAREHGKLLACIVEEITQVLGLPNDSERAYPSIFNDETPEDLLSPLDVILLKLLYEPQLTAGMNEQQVREIIRPILQRYKKDGTLESAVSISTGGELFQLVGY